MEARLAEVQRLLGELDPQPAGYYGNSPLRLSDELEVKGAVFYAVIVGGEQPVDKVKVLKETWAGDVLDKDVTFFVEGDIAERGEVNTEQLSSSRAAEVQVLDYICQSKLNSTKWFFIANDDVYVKTRPLERFLTEVDALQFNYGYLGKPIKREPIGRVCMPGPGSLLSHVTLQELCPNVKKCDDITPLTECTLGECIRRQLPRLQCNKEGHPHDQFLKFDGGKRGPITEQKHRAILKRALTVYPVSDPKLMYTIHQLLVAERLNISQYHLQETKSSLDHVSNLLPQSIHGETEEATITRDDLVPWKLISSNLLMSEELNAPAIKIPAVWKSEFDSLIEKAMEYLSTWEEGSYSFKRVVNGYFRVAPRIGVEYIIDFEGTQVKKEDKDSLESKHFRVILSRQFDSLEVNPVALNAAGVESKYITIAVVMTSEHFEKFQYFMSMLEKVLRQDQRLRLLLVNMKSKWQKSDSTTDLKSILNLYETKYPQASFTMLDSPSLLSREHSVSLAIREMKPNDIVFLADLDLDFDAGFLERCRSLPLQGQQAYFPLSFSKTDPTFLKEMSKEMMENTLSEHSGHWLAHSFGVSCLYASDILTAVQQPEGKGIPNSVAVRDVYTSLVEKGYEIVVSTDKGLRLKYARERECEDQLLGEEERDCNRDGNTNYSDLYIRTQLSSLLFDHQGPHEKF